MTQFCVRLHIPKKLHYWSLDDEQAAIKAESCDDCGTYLKILYQEKEPKVEAVADDLASLVIVVIESISKPLPIKQC